VTAWSLQEPVILSERIENAKSRTQRNGHIRSMVRGNHVRGVSIGEAGHD
jgi:hypothetical protein